MEIRTLYKYERDGGGTTVSPIQPAEGVPYTEMYRVVADEGMLVTQDGENKYPVIDTDTKTGWYEVEGEQRPDPLAELYNLGGGKAQASGILNDGQEESGVAS